METRIAIVEIYTEYCWFLTKYFLITFLRVPIVLTAYFFSLSKYLIF